MIWVEAPFSCFCIYILHGTAFGQGIHIQKVE